ncbi:MAG: MBL fold metallo-hydrolase [Spirochaetaceae bacterium]|nr:MAG: MBL fold metallo-hydrolase [Spirochaetaceae bacterium]
MKVQRVSEHIYSLRAWMIVPIHVWLVQGKEGLTLVDAGVSPMTKGIMRAVEHIGHGPIQRVLLTHGHIDHVGALSGILAKNPVPVSIHESELAYAEGRLPYPGRNKAQQTLKPGVATALAMSGAEIGGLVPHHTPGHSPGHSTGHVVYYHPADGVLLSVMTRYIRKSEYNT